MSRLFPLHLAARLPRRLAAVMVAVLLLAAPATAADTVGFVRRFGDEAIAMLRDRAAGEAERRQRFEQLMRSGFDLPLVAQLALGRHWRSATGEQRAEYVGLFEQLVLGTYARRLDEYGDQRLRVVGAVPAGQDSMVESWIEGSGEPIRVDWRVRETAGGARIVDVVIAGVSMLVTQRGEFAAVIERSGGVAGLIDNLRQRVASAGQVRSS
ncbi:MAG TPA: ABC transporter substrate-binding protein [Geminicoccaceae bacterium]|mgnify:CR=1 FL=1|nr:ABC transporter substrate-binding protein [Geminicoccus sp.]HMU50963.1 ABC transporter substrate-binding protein [Geminicoccaceae bacterium]